MRKKIATDIKTKRTVVEQSSRTHMKRMSLVLDERLLGEAKRVLSARTDSDAVNRALEEIVRLHKIQSLPSFLGSGIWEGRLSEMRNDPPCD